MKKITNCPAIISEFFLQTKPFSQSHSSTFKMSAYLDTITTTSPEAISLLEEIKRTNNKRLWHQLTKALRKFVILDEVQTYLVDFFNNFLKSVQSRINSFQYVEMVLFVVRNMSNMDDALKCLDDVNEQVSSDKLAAQLIKITKATIILENKSDEMSLRTVRTIVNELSPELEKEDGVNAVHSRFYEMAAHYYSKQSNHASFYRNTLRYLGCRELENNDSGADSNKFESSFEPVGFKLCLAALLADNVYNFGELLQHGILEPVRNGPNKWIVELLEAFNSGDINIIKGLSHVWENQADLSMHKDRLVEKWMLSALMEAVFSRASKDRVLPFSYITQRTGLENDKVEWLVMRALALDLVKGSIDQVEQTATLTWVQPRVLDKNQISLMAGRVNGWVRDVESREKEIYTRAQEIVQF